MSDETGTPRCRYCGRTLTSEESIRLGAGPVCIAKARRSGAPRVSVGAAGLRPDFDQDSEGPHFNEDRSRVAYRGRRGDGRTIVEATLDGGDPRPLPMRTDLWDYLSGGADWGRVCPGAAQLALAIAAHALGDGREEDAAWAHQGLQRSLVASWPSESWAVPAAAVRDACERFLVGTTSPPLGATGE